MRSPTGEFNLADLASADADVKHGCAKAMIAVASIGKNGAKGL